LIENVLNAGSNFGRGFWMYGELSEVVIVIGRSVAFLPLNIMLTPSASCTNMKCKDASNQYSMGAKYRQMYIHS
jgi:hypothetical protein